MASTPPPSPRLNSEDISLLLSPTKARLAAATTASWQHITTALTPLFAPNPIPPFERNATTLKALLDLVGANEAADTERRILHEARQEALTTHNESLRTSPSPKKQLLHDIEAALSGEGHDSLSALAASTVLLSCPVSAMESRITELTATTFGASNVLLSLQQTQRSFERERKQLEETISRLKAATDPEVLNVESMQLQTATMNRETKAVGMKLAEYRERNRALERYEVGDLRIEDVTTKEEEVQRRQDELERLEAKIVAMYGLPPDLDVSRKEVERARNELEEWKRRRDRAFEGLVE